MISAGVGSASRGEMIKAGRWAGLAAARMKGSTPVIRGAAAAVKLRHHAPAAAG